MRADTRKISTKRDDRQTVSAMLDLAQSRGWDAVKLRGTEDFRREAWVQAQVRGIETTGYKPKDTDVQEARQRTTAQAPAAQKNGPSPVKINPQAPPKAPPVAVEKPAASTARAKENADLVQESAGKQAAYASQRQQHTSGAVWGSVEAAGSQARAQDAASQGEKPVAAAKARTVEAA